jgi:hypothetical protein
VVVRVSSSEPFPALAQTVTFCAWAWHRKEYGMDQSSARGSATAGHSTTYIVCHVYLRKKVRQVTRIVYDIRVKNGEIVRKSASIMASATPSASMPGESTLAPKDRGAEGRCRHRCR